MYKCIPIIILLIFALVGCSVDDSPSIPNDSRDVITSPETPPSDSEQTREEDIETVPETVIQAESKTLAATETSSKTETVYTPSVEKYVVLDDATAEKMYLEAKIMLSDIVAGGIGCDYNDSIIVDGDIYYRVTDGKYSNYKSFISLLKTYFTDRCVNEILSEASEYIEHKGNTYVVGFGMGSNIHVGDDTYIGFSVKEKEAEIYISTELLDDDLMPADTVVNTFRLKFEDGYWRFDNFYLNLYDFKIEFDRDENETAPKTGTSMVSLAITATAALVTTFIIMKKKRVKYTR